MTSALGGHEGPKGVTIPLATAKLHDAVALVTIGRAVEGNEHDRASRTTLLHRIAALLEVEPLVTFDRQVAEQRSVLAIPSDSIDAALAATIGVTGGNILGGIVPAGFVATKAIIHPLIHPDAYQPAGWSSAMTDLIGDVVLHGYTAFSQVDAHRAGRLLLALGPVRIKDVNAKAGLGQIAVCDDAALQAVLSGQDAATLSTSGIVLEENLTEVATYSVGSVRLGDSEISYWGTQSLTTDHQGRDVYGGSDIVAVRGGFGALAELELPSNVARAVECAARFDDAAHAAYPGLALTRRNYDVIEGTDAAGRRRIAVLEQSWRVGGASGAEIAAFEAFKEDPHLPSIRCSTVELYDLAPPPVGAIIYYQGHDPVVGPMTKYVIRQS